MSTTVDSTVFSEQALDVYLDSRRRYADYFLGYPKRIGNAFAELAVELPNLQSAFDGALQSGEYEAIPEFWNAVKDLLWDHGYWQVFIEWGESTLDVLHKLSNLENEAWVLSELGWFWMEQGEFDTAREMFVQAKKVFSAIEHYKGLCAVERYLGVLAYRVGDLEKASAQYKTALEMATSQNLTGMIAEIKNLQGSLARKLGDFASARDSYGEAREQIERLGDQWRLTAVLRNLARMEFQLGNWRAARDRFQQAIDLCLQIDRKDMLYGCQLGLAEAELKLGDVEEATTLAVSAKDGFAELGMKRDLDEANQFLTNLYQQR